MKVKKSYKPLTVGFTYDVIPPSVSEEERKTILENGEFDPPETIESIINSLKDAGNRVIPIEVYKGKDKNGDPYDAYYILDRLKPELDIVFNICLGYRTKNRESLIPAILEWLGIPHTGSDLSALAKASNKADTIEILRNYGVNVVPYIIFKTSTDRKQIESYLKRLKMTMPLVVKPLAEGSSIGLDQSSVIEEISQLEKSIKRIIEEYDQPAVVQDYLPGKEYTVGILGNLILPVLVINLEKIPGSPKVRDHDVKEIDSKYSKPLKFSNTYLEIAAMAAVSHTALGCVDYNRFDLREGNDGKIYILEANPLPGLHPENSDFPKECHLSGIPYDVMVNLILLNSIYRLRNEPGYAERFSEKRIKYLEDYVQPTLNSLEKYPAFVEGNPANRYELLKRKTTS